MSNQETAKTRPTQKSLVDFGRSFARSVFLRRRRSRSGSSSRRRYAASRSPSERLRRFSAAILLVAFVLPTVFGNLFHQHGTGECCENAPLKNVVSQAVENASVETEISFLADEQDASRCPICQFFSHCQSFVFVFSTNALDDATLKIAPTPSQVLFSTSVFIRRGRAPPRTLFC